MKHIFGFCADYDKVVYGMTQILILARNDDIDAIFRANAADEGRVTLDNVSWPFPIVMSKVRQRNEHVRSRVCTLGLPGLRRSATPPVCWKRWRNQIIVFL